MFPQVSGVPTVINNQSSIANNSKNFWKNEKSNYHIVIPQDQLIKITWTLKHFIYTLFTKKKQVPLHIYGYVLCICVHSNDINSEVGDD